MSGMPQDPKSTSDASSGNSDYRSQGEYGTRMNGGPDAAGSYSEDLAAFQEVLPKRYQILREVGRGGMGQVLLALDRGPKLDRNQLVAIKRMLGPYLADSESIKRFYDEIELARELRHPNVVKMYHSDETRLGPYIVMEYIEGKDLGVYIKERGPLSESQSVAWFSKLAEAIDEGHRKGLIHRDIKPSNILISKDGEPYLADFGIARRVSAMDKTGTGLGAGTIEFMSLEQLRNGRSEISQDIYSFGATLFHVVEGRPPFESSNLVDFITRLASQSAPRATRVSSKLADRIASCLSKAPGERPSSCQAVMRGLVADPPVVRVGRPPIVVEEKPVPVSNPVAARVVKQPKRIFGIRALGLLGMVCLALWWLMVAGPSYVGHPKGSSASKQDAVARKDEASPAISESKPVAKPPKTEPKVTLEIPERITNSLGMEFRLIQPGTFMMGTKLTPQEVHQRYPGGDEKYYEGETAHRVELTRPFYLGVHEVTVGQFRKFVKAEKYKTEAVADGKGGWGFDGDLGYTQDPKFTWENPGFVQDQTHPVVNVSWNDAIAYAKWLSGVEGREYRLPTEAEWEYTCRGGSSSEFSFGDDAADLVRYGNVADETLKDKIPGLKSWLRLSDGAAYTNRVGSYKPNDFGLYDMHGNVWEWCSDWYRDYPSGAVRDPMGPSTGSYRVCRGGSWSLEAAHCRSASRNGNGPSPRYNDLGFRLALSSGLR
ncbi:MAG: bifunctional serine/threonine-protein kinase/formylglycine-generating enzyme family protein [Pirellula sp.]